jgi:hypothetical protein
MDLLPTTIVGVRSQLRSVSRGQFICRELL